MRGEIAVPTVHVLAGLLGEYLHRAGELLMLDVDHRIGTIGGDHPAFPAAIVDGVVRRQVVLRPLGGGQEADVEPVEQRPRLERVGRELFVDRVVIMIRSARIERHVEAEHLAEHMAQPHRRGRAAEEVGMFGERPPCRARIGRRHPGLARHAQVVERHTLRIEHAVDVVIRREQQFGRVRPVGVGREPGRIGMPVRADDRQPGHFGIERTRDAPRAIFRRKQPVGV